jgi:hypothetical protein
MVEVEQFWSEQAKALVREHISLTRRQALPALPGDTTDEGLGAAPAPSLDSQALLAQWAARWPDTAALAPWLESLTEWRRELLARMGALPKDPPGPIADARAQELAATLAPLRRGLSRWTALHWAITSAGGHVAGGAQPCPVASLNRHEPGLSLYNSIRDRLYRRTEGYRKKRAQYDATPERRDARKSAITKLRANPEYRAREASLARARYQARRKLEREVSALMADFSVEDT